jgi:CO/xanthine dehydrogenase Mo-binding subunit
MGEGPIVPPPAVIANAVEAALGDLDVAIYATPLTPDRVLSMIAASRDQG